MNGDKKFERGVKIIEEGHSSNTGARWGYCGIENKSGGRTPRGGGQFLYDFGAGDNIGRLQK